MTNSLVITFKNSSEPQKFVDKDLEHLLSLYESIKSALAVHKEYIEILYNNAMHLIVLNNVSYVTVTKEVE